MGNPRVIGPFLVLVLQVAFKFLIGRKLEYKNFLDLIYELPTNIVFLSISYFLAYLILNEPVNLGSILYFLGLIAVSPFIVAGFRVCQSIGDETPSEPKKRPVSLILLLLFNYLISTYCLVFASQHLMTKNTIPKTSQSQVKQESLSK